MARPGLRNHPKFRRLVAMLAEPEPHVWGYLECLWEVAYEKGDPDIGDEATVVLCAKYPYAERASAFVQALETCGGTGRSGFIEVSNAATATDSNAATDSNGHERFCVHDLYSNAPSYVHSRAVREEERANNKLCEHCGNAFMGKDSRAKFCSSACRNKSWKKQATDSNASQRKPPLPERIATDVGATPAPAPAPAPIKKETHPTARSDLQDSVADFLQQWNATEGVRPCPDQFAVGSPALLVDRFGDPAWCAAWPKALAKFPLKCFSQPVSVSQFIGEDFVRKVLSGHYDFDPGKNGGKKPTRSTENVKFK